MYLEVIERQNEIPCVWLSDMHDYGIIIKANDKVKAAEDPENMLKELN